MDEQEIDPMKCRDFRRADREIQAEMERVVADHRRLEPILAAARAELQRLYRELEKLREAQAAATVASGAPGAGAAAGLLSAGLGVEIDRLTGSIAEQQREHDSVENELQRSRDRQQDLNERLAENARQMRTLNCVI